MKRLSAVLIAVALVLTACGDSKPSRKAVMTGIADKFIVPAYQAANDSAAKLVPAVEAACSPSPRSGADAVAAVTATRNAWGQTEPVWQGPVMTDRLASLVDYPIDTKNIDKVLADRSFTFDQESVARKTAANQRGLTTVEYLLTTGSMSDARQCAYATSAAKVVKDGTQRALDGWTKGSGGKPAYRNMFIGADAKSDADDSLDTLINDSITLLHKMSDIELIAAIGRDGKAGDITAIPEGPAGQYLAYDKARMAGLRAVVVGSADQPGLSELIDVDLVDRLTKAFGDVDTALNAINGSLREAVASDRADVVKVRDTLEELRRIESTELVSGLGVTVGFSDADGDSSG